MKDDVEKYIERRKRAEKAFAKPAREKPPPLHEKLPPGETKSQLRRTTAPAPELHGQAE